MLRMDKETPKGEQSLVLTCTNCLDSDKKLISSVTRLRSCRIELLFPSIPKQITTSGEKYVLRYLELIHDYKADVSDTFLVKYPIITDRKIDSIIDIRKNLSSSLVKVFGSTELNASSSTIPRLQFRYLLSGETEYESVFGFGSSMNSDKFSPKGKLECTWKDEVPYHIFSVEDKKVEVYTASVSKAEYSNDKSLDCVYTFYSGKQRIKDHDSTKIKTVATMLVFTSITLCSNLEQIKETKFILYAYNDEEINSNNTRKSRLPRNMTNMFKKQLSISRNSGKTALSDHSDEKDDLTSHENAAIVIREICNDSGWGLNFLKKSSENNRKNGECSTSMNVLIPAGIHGRTKGSSGDPSTLVERWISGGECDCGGWDMGCPLTVLESKYNTSDSFNLFIKESRQDAAVWKMESVREGVYSIDFQSRLSNLQSFAIAIAVIHSRYRELHRC